MNGTTISTLKTSGRHRDSSIELFRIVTMLCIVAHHYVVNSGILDEITAENAMVYNSLFSLLFEWVERQVLIVLY